MKKIVLSLLVGCSVCPLVSAQTRDEVAVKPLVWSATVAGGEYIVKVAAMTSIGRHSYILDGALVVNEVTIDSVGDSLVRFYFIEPVSPEALDAVNRLQKRAVELSNSVLERGGVTEQTMVQKTYPVTTHSKIVEYRMLTRESLDALYDSAKEAFTSGVGREFE